MTAAPARSSASNCAAIAPSTNASSASTSNASSSRTGRAVSLHAAGVYTEKLLVLPAFMTGDTEPDWEQLLQGFALTGHFIERQFFADRRTDPLAARGMMIDRLKRMVA